MSRLSVARKNGSAKAAKKLGTQQSVDQRIEAVCEVMRRGNVTEETQYVAELTWLLFLRILDETEEREAEEARILGHAYTPNIAKPYRWSDWGRPIPVKADKEVTNRRRELTESGAGKLLEFVNSEVIPHLKRMREKPDASPRQRIIAETLSGVQQVRIDTETNFLEVLDKLHDLSSANVDSTHTFVLSQVYEGLLLEMGQSGRNGGKFFTPREVIRAMVKVIDPRFGERVFDPCCGTGGFLAQAAEYLHDKVKTGGALPKGMSAGRATEIIKHETFYGREKDDLIYPIALANLILHGIDDPHIWHGNTLTGNEVYGGLFKGAPGTYEVVLTNPPFGGKENTKSITGFDYVTSKTELLFLQSIIRSLSLGGRCGVVVPEGVLYRNKAAYTKTKKKLLEECDLWCVVSLPGGVFTASGAGVKTNLLFFTRGKATETIWYYDLSKRKVGKKKPLTMDDFEEFFELLPGRGDSDRSWTLDFTARRRKGAEDARPFRQTEAEKKEEARALKDALNEMKESRPLDEAKVAEAEAVLNAATRAARVAAKKAEAIETAVYDLKAVNPHRKADVDKRTPGQLLDLIEAKGTEVAEALAVLRGLDTV